MRLQVQFQLEHKKKNTNKEEKHQNNIEEEDCKETKLNIKTDETKQ